MKNELYFKEQLDQAQEREKIMRKIATRTGFYQFWFDNLPKFETRSACFNYVNDLYLDFFGEEKYSSYDSFERSHNNKSKKK